MMVNSTKVLKIFLHDVCKVQCLLPLSCSKLNLNGGQPRKFFWFEASKHLKMTSKRKSPFF